MSKATLGTAFCLLPALAWLATAAPAPIPSNKWPTRGFDNSIGMKLVRIPAGKFLMGSRPGDAHAEPAEFPQRQVEISKPFYLGAYEVTQGEYQRVIGSNPSRFSASGPGKESVRGLDTTR